MASTTSLHVNGQPKLTREQLANRPPPKNYKTVPCRKFHGPGGNLACTRGEQCHFIHNELYRGQDIPREVLMQLREENKQKYGTVISSLP